VIKNKLGILVLSTLAVVTTHASRAATSLPPPPKAAVIPTPTAAPPSASIGLSYTKVTGLATTQLANGTKQITIYGDTNLVNSAPYYLAAKKLVLNINSGLTPECIAAFQNTMSLQRLMSQLAPTAATSNYVELWISAATVALPNVANAAGALDNQTITVSNVTGDIQCLNNTVY